MVRLVLRFRLVCLNQPRFSKPGRVADELVHINTPCQQCRALLGQAAKQIDVIWIRTRFVSRSVLFKVIRMVVHKSGQCLVDQGQHLQGCLLIRRTACQNAIHDSDGALVCHQSRVGAIEVSYVVGTFTSGKGMHIATECNLSPKHWMMACRMTWSRSRSHNPSSVSNMKVEIGPYEEVTCMSRHA